MYQFVGQMCFKEVHPFVLHTQLTCLSCATSQAYRCYTLGSILMALAHLVDIGAFYAAMPMTPHAGRPPALPVFLLSAWPPFPRSSVPACTTTVRPRTLSGPISLMSLSSTEPFALPCPSVLKFPRSPTWRSESSGAPCSFWCGLTIVVLSVSVLLTADSMEVRPLTVRSCTGAAIGVVAECVNVHATLSVGVVAGDVPCYSGWRSLAVLCESDGALDVGVTTENSDCVRVSAASSTSALIHQQCHHLQTRQE